MQVINKRISVAATILLVAQFAKNVQLGTTSNCGGHAQAGAPELPRLQQMHTAALGRAISSLYLCQSTAVGEERLVKVGDLEPTTAILKYRQSAAAWLASMQH